MKDIKSILNQFFDLIKIPAYYFVIISGSILIGSGIGLITNSTRIGSDSVGSGFVAVGFVIIVFLSVFQGKLLSQGQGFVEIKFRNKSMNLRRTIIDALLFQYYLFSYGFVFGLCALWIYFKNGEPMNDQTWIGYFIVMPICLVVAHNNVGKFMRWVFALIPLVLILIFLCLIKFR